MATQGDKKTVVIIGGTGEFGGSVATSLNNNPEFHVRVTTRDPTTEKAQKKQQQGIEVVKADSWKTEELLQAFAGALAIYVNTDSDDPNFKARIGPPELDMGIIIVDAAIRAGIKHFVFAGLPDASQITNGEVPILAFDTKTSIWEYALKAGFMSAIRVKSGWSLENFHKILYREAFGGFHAFPDIEGYLTLKVPPLGNDPELVPWMAVRDDYGDQVHALLLDSERYNGRTVWLSSDATSFRALPDAYNKALGSSKARYVTPTGAINAGTPEKAKEVTGLFRYCHWVKGNYCDGKAVNLDESRALKLKGAKAAKKSGAGLELTTVEKYYSAMSDKTG